MRSLTLKRRHSAHAAPRPPRSRSGRLATVGATLAALTGSLLMVSAPTASAAGVCGSSYQHIDTYRMTGDAGTRGYIYLYYSPSGYNCAVAKPVSWWAGDAELIKVDIWDSQGHQDSDPSGSNQPSYSYYAGPVYVHAPNECISVQAFFWGPDNNFYSGGAYDVHCG